MKKTLVVTITIRGEENWTDAIWEEIHKSVDRAYCEIHEATPEGYDPYIESIVVFPGVEDSSKKVN